MTTFTAHSISGLLVVISVCIIIFLIRRQAAKQHQRHNSVYCSDFLQNWDKYRPNDKSGCYVILIWNRKPPIRSIENKSRYDEVYVGQSVNMYKRVYCHLTGHGNGDVYADVRDKKFAYITFIPCKISKLNNLEKKLIQQYNATESYNRTKGGSKITKFPVSQ